MFLKSARTAIITIALFTLITGVIYPLLVTGIAQLTFPGKANGSLIKKEGRVIGSELIGQPFSDAKYFWSRLSATTPIPYNAAASSGSNFGPLNPALIDGAKKRIQDLRSADSLSTASIPVDLVTASGSGLDPHISPENAAIQSKRIQNLRGIPADKMNELIEENTDDDMLGLWGCEGVNVLKLNCALDDFEKGKK